MDWDAVSAVADVIVAVTALLTVAFLLVDRLRSHARLYYAWGRTRATRDSGIMIFTLSGMTLSQEPARLKRVEAPRSIKLSEGKPVSPASQHVLRRSGKRPVDDFEWLDAITFTGAPLLLETVNPKNEYEALSSFWVRGPVGLKGKLTVVYEIQGRTPPEVSKTVDIEIPPPAS